MQFVPTLAIALLYLGNHASQTVPYETIYCDVQFHRRFGAGRLYYDLCDIRFWLNFGEYAAAGNNTFIWSSESSRFPTAAVHRRYHRPSRIEAQYEHTRVPALFAVRNATDLMDLLENVPVRSSVIIEVDPIYFERLTSLPVLALISERSLDIWITTIGLTFESLTSIARIENLRILPVGSSKAFTSHAMKQSSMSALRTARGLLISCFRVGSDDYVNYVVESLGRQGILCENVSLHDKLADQYFETMFRSKFFVLIKPPSFKVPYTCDTLRRSHVDPTGIIAAAEILSTTWIFDAISAGAIPLVYTGPHVPVLNSGQLSTSATHILHTHPSSRGQSAWPLCEKAAIGNNVSVPVSEAAVRIIRRARQQLGVLPILEVQDWGTMTHSYLETSYSQVIRNRTLGGAVLGHTTTAVATILPALSTAFWLNKLIPFDAIDQHIPRGISRVKVFYEEYIPDAIHALGTRRSRPKSSLVSSQTDTKTALENSPTRWRTWESIRREFPNSIFLLRNAKSSKSKRGATTPKPDSSIADICRPAKHATNRNPHAQGGAVETVRTNGQDDERTVEIVIPRCCESVKGDLWWLAQLLEYTAIHASVYYKCPWCISEALLDEFVAENVENRTHDGNRSDNPSLRVEDFFRVIGKSGKERDALMQLTREKGGVQVIDNILPSKSMKLREFVAFDAFVNGKEATAYLEHIMRNYHGSFDSADGHQRSRTIAQYTVFLHTQPAHHLNLDRFLRFLRYAYACTDKTAHSGSRSNKDNTYSKDTRAVASFDFLNLNYRWLHGPWAHQPEQCVMSLLRYQFAGSTKYGDDARYNAVKDIDIQDLKKFNDVKMASGAAAQFVVSREAIMRRPLSWWTKLQAANNGSVSLTGCSHRNYRIGTEVASAMERLWHNFFRDASDLSDPLYLPDTDEDTLIPPFLGAQAQPTGGGTPAKKARTKASTLGGRSRGFTAG